MKRLYQKLTLLKSSKLQAITAAPPLSGKQLESDSRLKSDIAFRKITGTGIRLYDFRYLGDDRTFSGVMAQDLLADDAHAHAVKIGEGGYLRVDYTALRLDQLVTGAMRAAGAQALSRALHK